jgi:hypothetical protein
MVPRHNDGVCQRSPLSKDKLLKSETQCVLAWPLFEEFHLLPPAFTLVSCSVYSSTLKVEAIYSSETWVVFQRTTRSYNPEDRNLHNHHCHNLNSYISGDSYMYKANIDVFFNSEIPATQITVSGTRRVQTLFSQSVARGLPVVRGVVHNGLKYCKVVTRRLVTPKPRLYGGTDRNHRPRHRLD